MFWEGNSYFPVFDPDAKAQFLILFLGFFYKKDVIRTVIKVNLCVLDNHAYRYLKSITKLYLLKYLVLLMMKSLKHI